MESWQFLVLIVPISQLIPGILISEKNFMIGIDGYVDKISKKYDKVITKFDYCRFEGMQRIITATDLMIVVLVCILFNMSMNNTFILIVIWGIIDLLRYTRKRKIEIDKFPAK